MSDRQYEQACVAACRRAGLSQKALEQGVLEDMLLALGLYLEVTRKFNVMFAPTQQEGSVTDVARLAMKKARPHLDW